MAQVLELAGNRAHSLHHVLPALDPPTYNLYMISLMLKEYERVGGVDALESRAIRRAATIYGAVGDTNGFYVSAVGPSCRSRMSAPLRIHTPSGEPNEALEAKLIAEAAADGIEQLFLHPLLPGLRVTMYNALPGEGVAKVAECMSKLYERSHAHGGGEGGLPTSDLSYQRAAY